MAHQNQARLTVGVVAVLAAEADGAERVLAFSQSSSGLLPGPQQVAVEI